MRMGGSLATCSLPWGGAHAKGWVLPPTWQQPPAVVLAADCIYHTDLMKPLLDTLLELGMPLPPLPRCIQLHSQCLMWLPHKLMPLRRVGMP